MRATRAGACRRRRFREESGGRSRSWRVAARGNAFALADAHLRHGLNQFTSGSVGSLECLAEHLHLIAFFLCRNRETVCRLIGTVRRSAAPRAIDELASDEIVAFAC